MDLIEELGLETNPFPPYMADQSPDTLFDLDRDEPGQIAASSEPRLLTTLELLTLGILRVLGQSPGDLDDPRDPRHWQWWAGLDETYYHYLRTEATFLGEPLHQFRGLAAGFGKTLDSEVVVVQPDGSQHHDAGAQEDRNNFV